MLKERSDLGHSPWCNLICSEQSESSVPLRLSYNYLVNIERTFHHSRDLHRGGGELATWEVGEIANMIHGWMHDTQASYLNQGRVRVMLRCENVLKWAPYCPLNCECNFRRESKTDQTLVWCRYLTCWYMSTLLFCPAVIDQMKGGRNLSDFIVIQLRLSFSLNLI